VKALSLATAVALMTLGPAAEGQAQKTVDVSKLVARRGSFYEINSDKPFTGTVVEYWPGGRKKFEGQYRDGEPHGLVTQWYAIGGKMEEGECRDGSKHGKWTEWYATGGKMSETEFRDGEKDGKCTLWYENGQKKAEGEYQDGEKSGEWTEWSEDEKKEEDDGKKNEDDEKNKGKGEISDVTDNSLKKWSVLGSGTNDYIGALVWGGSSLYVGGQFTRAGNVSANNIARWDGSAWHALGTGVEGGMFGIVETLFWGGSNLYVGGWFIRAGNVSASNIARWDGSAWYALGSGLDAIVYALEWDGSNLYAGGHFSDMTAGYRGLARWDGTVWSAVEGSQGKPCCHGPVYALDWDGSSLYVAGRFDRAAAVSANNIARWDGSAWHALGSGLEWGFQTGVGPTTWDSEIFAMVRDGSNLYVGGIFDMAGGVSANNIARWDGTAWSPLGSGTDGEVLALAWDGSNLYAGGNFSTAGGVSANNVARWDGSAWSPLGSGVDNPHDETDFQDQAQVPVETLLWHGSNLYMGGDFIKVGGVSANHVARW